MLEDFERVYLEKVEGVPKKVVGALNLGRKLMQSRHDKLILNNSIEAANLASYTLNTNTEGALVVQVLLRGDTN